MTPFATARRLGAAVTLTALAAALAVATGASPAGATTTVSHNPIGDVRNVTAVTGGLLVTGWAGDPDAATSNTPVQAIIDGKTIAASGVTSVAMPKVTAKHDLGATPGFALTVPVPTGNHTVCIVAKNTGAGLDTVLDCVLTPLGRAVTSGVTAASSPRGAITHGWASKHSVVFSGWADDPNDLFMPSVVTLYLDGSQVASDVTSSYAWPRPRGASSHSAFSFRVPVSSGAHMACLWVGNVGLGQNTFLGCKAVDTRSRQPFTTAAPAGTGAKVVKEAKKHIGQRYVYGTEGPKTFDCSGLVTYSYGKFGYSLPHQSGMQFALARVIPASSAVPGDLVFYHDSTGEVYHVGIYTGPGMTVAAIDTAEGVNYQPIYSSTWATYGSFTHTATSSSTSSS